MAILAADIPTADCRVSSRAIRRNSIIFANILAKKRDGFVNIATKSTFGIAAIAAAKNFTATTADPFLQQTLEQQRLVPLLQKTTALFGYK